MNPRALHDRHLLAAAAFVAAVLVLTVQLITPSPVVVSVGENGAEATRLGQYFSYADVATVAAAACLLGASGTYLLVGDPTPTAPPTGRPGGDAAGDRADGRAVDGGRPRSEAEAGDDYEAIAARLEHNEEAVYTVVLDAGGEIPQREIVDETDLSKATVSRTLDSLERRGLVVRERRGMGNVVTFR